MSAMRGRAVYAGLTVVVVALGLICRSPAVGLPWLIAKYAGSALWAAMVYLGLRAAAPRAPVVASALAAATIAAGVEAFKLYRQPALDAFRLTLAGRLLLGRIFSTADLLAYALAIAAAAFIDARVRTRQGTTARR